jgi:hypothetical protein
MKLNLKTQNIYIKPLLKHLKYLQQTMFETLLKQKVAQKVAIILGYFIFSKKHNELPKVAQLAKNYQIWSPCQWYTDTSPL